jgi:serine/threonine protein kinase
LLDYFPLPKK